MLPSVNFHNDFIHFLLNLRFQRYIDFQNWNSEDCLMFIGKKAQANNFTLDEAARKIISDGTKKVKFLRNIR